MRNLKKILALVLALMMTVSLMVVASAASYKDYADADEISAEYETAVAVLTGMGVFKGDEDGFRPQDTITRAEVSTSVYRVLSGDVEDANVEVWKEYTMFDDVASDAWYAGFVNYAANVKWVIGVGNNKFDPSSDVTGYEMLAILLRALGYDKNQEFASSDDWRIEVAAIAEEIGLTDVLVSANLNRAMTREQIAALMFQALNTSTVKYTLAYGYRPTGETLGEDLFNLTPKTDVKDAWGRPQYGWSYDVGDEGTYWDYDYTLYTEAVRECDTGVSGTVTTYTNGNVGTDNISATATNATIGAQGQQTYVYPNVEGSARIVYVDTFYAVVTDVTEARYDDKGHVAREALLELAVYNGTNPQTVYLTSNTNWEYAERTALLVNAITTSEDSLIVKTAEDSVVGYARKYDLADDTLEIYDVATSFVGAQTYRQWSNDQHTIDGEVYDDAVRFYLDDAGMDKTENFTWWLDQYGNLIAATEIDRTGYAVLKDLRWIVGTPGYAQATLINMDGSEYTATVATIDGFDFDQDDWDEDDAVPELDDVQNIGFIDNAVATGDVANVSSDTRYNGLYEGYALYQVYTNDNGTVNLQGWEDKDSDNAVERGEYIIDYTDNAILDINSSAILDRGNSVVVHLSNNTQFVVNNGDGTYSTYTGTASLPDFAWDTVEVFYDSAATGVNNTRIASAVYVKSYTLQASFGAHLFTINSTVGTPVGSGVWEMTVVVDGVERVIRTTSTHVLDILTDKGNVGKLFHVWWDTTPGDDTYGHVTDVQLVNEYSDYIHLGGYTGVCDYLDDSAYVSGNTIVSGTDSYTVNDATVFITLDGTEVYYDLSDLNAALNDETTGTVGVWVVDNRFDGIYNVADVVYVGTKLDTTNTIGVSVDGAALTASAANAYTYKIEYKGGTADVAIDFDCKYGVYAISKNGGALTYYRGDHAPVEIAGLVKGDVVTVRVWNEEYVGLARPTATYTITMDGWDKIGNAVTKVTYTDDQLLDEASDVYYSYAEAVANANVNEVNLLGKNGMRVYFDPAKIALTADSAVPAWGVKVVTFADTYAAQGATASVFGGADVNTYYQDVAYNVWLPFDTTDTDGFIVVLELTPQGGEAPVYVAYHVTNNKV